MKRNFTFKEIDVILRKNGYFPGRVKGSHQVYTHESTGKITVLVISRMSDTVPTGTLKNIEKQTGIKIL